MGTISFKTMLQNCVGEQLYNQLRIMRRRVQGQIGRVKTTLHNKGLSEVKGQVDDLFEDPGIRRLYLAQSIPYFFDAVPQKRQIFDKLWNEYRNPNTHLRDPIRLIQFMALLEIANAAPEGDYLEIGTHRGESAKVIFKLMDPSRTLFCIDTFEGFVDSDLVAEKHINPASTWQPGNFLDTSPEYVSTYVGDGTPPLNFKPIKGWFPDSYKGLENYSWRFIHLDMDLYEPTKIGLEVLWPQLVPGGVMVFHDFDNLSFPGVKIAVNDFFARLGLTVLPMGDLWGSTMIVKPQPTSA